MLRQQKDPRKLPEPTAMTTTFRQDETERLRAAQTLWQQGQVESARAVLDEILVRHPAHVEAATLLAKMLQGLGQFDAASNAMASLCRHSRADAATTFRCAQFVQQCQRQRLAASLCDEAFARGSTSAELHVLAGNIAKELGEFDSARAHYLAALEAGVDLNAWFVLGALATTQRYDTSTHPDFGRFIAHFHDTAYSLHSRATTGFGLAKAYDDLGDYANAAATLHEANRLSKQAQPWSREAWAQWLSSRMQQPRFEQSLQATSDFVPIFIVGLPRSGTTLAATQLARHPEVRDRGEMPMLNYIASSLQAGNHHRDAGVLREAAQLYQRLAVQDDPRVRWYIDQDPNNFRYLDLIAALFPQARIIHCQRGRRDTALSIWSQSFAQAHYGFANDFDDMADFFSGHDRLMEHWQQPIQLPIHRLDYEDMVSDPQSTLEKLRLFVGIPAGDASDGSSSSPAAITSASMWQARQPIYRSSVGRWEHYLPYVPELGRF
jgi:tetratricopeptide (TPR) repeat protein